jgi:hypothetical protein
MSEQSVRTLFQPQKELELRKTKNPTTRKAAPTSANRLEFVEYVYHTIKFDV